MKKTLWLFFLFATPIKAIMLTTDTLDTILERCDKDTLVVFDVDDTLIINSGDVHNPRLMQENALSILEQISQKGAKMMALTAREMQHLDGTIQQLENAGINFRPHSPLQIKFSSPCGELPWIHDSGIICCGSSSKAHVLNHLMSIFDDFNYQPRSIVFVDDRQENVEAVEDMFLEYPLREDQSMVATAVLYTRKFFRDQYYTLDPIAQDS